MNSTTKVIIGQKFNKLTIIEELPQHQESKRIRRKVRTQCECGNIYDVILTRLINSRTKSCLSCVKKEQSNNRSKYKIGQKFDKLTIIGFSKNNKKRMVLCKCDCGKQIQKQLSHLVESKHNNCGCISFWKHRVSGEISKTFFSRIRKSARARKIDFNISIEDIWLLFNQQNKKCALSGVDLLLPKTSTDTGTASLDRIDSSKGYLMDNVQWTHKDINIMKNDLSEKDFFLWIKIIYNFNNF